MVMNVVFGVRFVEGAACREEVMVALLCGLVCLCRLEPNDGINGYGAILEALLRRSAFSSGDS